MISRKKKFYYYAFQLKVKARINKEKLLELGAKRKGSFIQEDKYFVKRGQQVNGKENWIRVRKDGSEDLIFTYKLPIENKRKRGEIALHKSITEKELTDIYKKYTEIISINKRRTIFIINDIIIHLDKVENLGEFIEFEVQKESDIYKIEGLITKLGLDMEDTTSISYFEMAVMNLSPGQRILYKISDKFGKFSFGISSAVLTTLGVIIGLNSATSSRIAVIGGIASIAIADSMSDAMGMYASKKADRGSLNVAFKSAFNTFLGKFIFALTFIIPFLFLSFDYAIPISILWGLLLLVFVNAQIAFIHEENIKKSVLKQIMIGTVIIFLSYLVGTLVGLWSK